MGTIADKLNKLQDTKQAIKQAIIDKGVEVTDNDTFESYADKISSIQSGGGTSDIKFQPNTLNLSGDTSDVINATVFDTSRLTTMYNMFKSCNNVTSLDLSGWNTSKVNNMNSMFQSCNNLTSLDLSGWDTSKVTNILYMFQYCNSLTLLNVSNWDTSLITSISGVFQNCMNLESLNLSDWDITKVTSMTNTFNICTNMREFNLNNIGVNSTLTSVYFSDFEYWGINNEKYPNARQSLINTLLTNSYDRASAGYSSCRISLNKNVKKLLTDDEIAAITSKGFTIA